MKTLLLLLALACAPVHAAPIRKGMNLDLLIRGMAKAGYAGGDRKFIHGGIENPTYSTSWTVDRGTLLATFDADTRKIISLFYTLNGEPEVPIGKHFQLEVEWFDCESGQMLIQLGEPAEPGRTALPDEVTEPKVEGENETKAETRP